MRRNFRGHRMGEVVSGEFSGVAEMRIPAFAGAHEENVIAGIGDDVAAIVKAKGKFCAGAGFAGSTMRKSNRCRSGA